MRLNSYLAVLPRIYGRHTTTHETKARAEAWLASELARRREHPATAALGDSIGAWCDAWLERVRHTLDPASHKRYDNALTRLNKTGIMRSALAALKPSDVESATAELVRLGYARETIRSTRFVLHNALEMRRILAAAESTPLALYIPLAVATGARGAELRALTWDDIDWRSSTIRLSRQMDEQGEVKDRTKGRRMRTVELPPFALGILRQTRAERDRASHWLFPGYKHRPLSYSAVWNAWRAVQLAAGIPESEVRKPHALRHTLVSICEAAFVPWTTIAETVGHASVSTTQAVYAHSQASHRGAVAAALEAALGGG